MSPEQIRGQTIDGRSDIWSLGVVFYEMLAGRHPFSGPTISDTIAAALEREPPAIGAPEHVPAEAERIVRKALAKDRDARYQSAKDLAIDLKTLARRRTIEADDRERNDVAGTRRATIFRYGLAVAAAVAVLGSLPFVLTVGPEPPAIPANERRVEYAVVVDPLRNGRPYQAPFEAAPDQVLASGSRFRLELKASHAGFLYLLSDEAAEDGAPLLRMLSPSPSVNDGNAAYAAGQPIETGWYRLDERAGTETLWIVWSAHAVQEFEEVKGVVNPDDLGVITGADRTGRIREYLAVKSAAQPEPPQPGSARRIGRAPGDVLVARVHLRHQ
jgi:Protein kinase domain